MAVPEGQDTADAHQPHEQQPGDFFGPGNWPMQEVSADDLQTDDGGLRGHEERNRRLERAIGARRRRPSCGRHARIASSHEATPSRCASASQSRSALRWKPVASISRIVIPRVAQLGLRSRVLLRSHGALMPRGIDRGPFDRPAQFGRQPCEPRGRRPQAEHAGDVTGACHMVRDFIEALLQGRARVVLVAVDDARLQRGVDLTERHRRRARAHELDGLHVDRRLNRPDLEPGEVRQVPSRHANA